ncbi:MAG TPA: glycosyltransferase, partial [Steroidobacteraceae bacterium]|nr:glycosyltransferase [Steroidobacteraceae bacterium]
MSATSAPSAAEQDVAVLVPCHNEAATIAQVVAEFRAVMPGATVYVYDNNSSDGTAQIAAAAGAIVRHEPLQGKGNVVRRMFADIEADIYLLVDGDGTYDIASAPLLIAKLNADRLDMVNCARMAVTDSAYRPGHAWGNRLLTALVAWIFGNRLGDILSGYRAMSRRFVKSFPALSSGFETETELTVHALEMRAPIGEISAPYRDRPQGSVSKLHTVRDGTRILQVILHLMKEERPLQFFSTVFLLLSAASVGIAWPV